MLEEGVACIGSDKAVKRSLNGIQLLRGIAAVGVVFTHSITRISMTFPGLSERSLFRTAAGGQWTIGDAGVDLFFVISGFIMLYSHSNDFGQPRASLKFMIKRARRILPLYWLITTAALLMLLIVPQLPDKQLRWSNFAWIVSCYLLIPFPSPSRVIAPVVGVGWTLIYEMFFYFLFAVALQMRMTLGLFCLSLVIGLLVALGAALKPAAPELRFFTSPLLLDFLAGLWICRWVSDRKQLGRGYGKWILFFCALCLAVTAVFPPPESGFYRLLAWGVPAALTVYTIYNFDFRDSRVWSGIKVFGDASYSIYLIQFLSLPALGVLFRVFGMRVLPFDVGVIVMTTAATIFGIFCWRLIERPLGRRVSQIGISAHST
jgi:exopolysaccharide production protein ExoZ